MDDIKIYAKISKTLGHWTNKIYSKGIGLSFRLDKCGWMGSNRMYPISYILTAEIDTILSAVLYKNMWEKGNRDCEKSNGHWSTSGFNLQNWLQIPGTTLEIFVEKNAVLRKAIKLHETPRLLDFWWRAWAAVQQLTRKGKNRVWIKLKSGDNDIRQQH